MCVADLTLKAFPYIFEYHIIDTALKCIPLTGHFDYFIIAFEVGVADVLNDCLAADDVYNSVIIFAAVCLKAKDLFEFRDQMAGVLRVIPSAA